MKKLTKSSIEELKQEMPVMSEEDQREIVGGAHIYSDYHGEFLGTDDTGDDQIIIMGESAYRDYKMYYCGNYPERSGSALGYCGAALFMTKNKYGFNGSPELILGCIISKYRIQLGLDNMHYTIKFDTGNSIHASYSYSNGIKCYNFSLGQKFESGATVTQILNHVRKGIQSAHYKSS